MSDSDHSQLKVIPLKGRRLWNTLERIRATLGLSDARFAEYLEMTSEEFARYRSLGLDPNVHHFLKLSERLNVGFEALLTGNLDFLALLRQHSGDSETMPDRYLVQASCRRRTAMGVLDFVEANFNYELRASLLRRLQVTEAAFRDPEQLVSIRLLLDLLEEVRQVLKSDRILVDIGKAVCGHLQGLSLVQPMHEVKAQPDLFEYIFQIVPECVDDNFRWRILKHTEYGIVIANHSTEQFRQAAGPDYLRSGRICRVHQGFASSLPRLGGRAQATVHHIRCVEQGDPECVYDVRFG